MLGVSLTCGERLDTEPVEEQEVEVLAGKQ